MVFFVKLVVEEVFVKCIILMWLLSFLLILIIFVMIKVIVVGVEKCKLVWVIGINVCIVLFFEMFNLLVMFLFINILFLLFWNVC